MALWFNGRTRDSQSRSASSILARATTDMAGFSPPVGASQAASPPDRGNCRGESGNEWGRDANLPAPGAYADRVRGKATNAGASPECRRRKAPR